MEKDFIRKRITELRLARGISERKMSLDLGHSTSYIRSITNGRSLPSMSEFLYLCDYLKVTPEEFFNEGYAFSEVKQEIIKRVQSMSDSEAELLLKYIQFLDKHDTD
ncbi:MAG: helix-turn-helix transcriptional regulator [Oscillospiraceae bacterium]|nr:helix-turn-helix transcriptional regulator [Oscillospiraceae bacterium]